jgi:hypothetical protein
MLGGSKMRGKGGERRGEREREKEEKRGEREEERWEAANRAVFLERPSWDRWWLNSITTRWQPSQTSLEAYYQVSSHLVRWCN